ncbi:hypothetical protein QAD02_003628 [Eretmocerus hayati]|uniref:Uncharacterized protein n=1 Tax=Eretmocerus hayati TaxID=131215 RepID=A0ACC2NM86_9HYME|nr:hypothetical protein QAD02_003628 [Eretmocerus hayati]
MALFYWIELKNGSVHVVPGIWLRRLDPEQVPMVVAWPTRVRAEQSGDSADSGLGSSPHGRFNERQDIDEPSHKKRKFSLSEDEPADDGNQFDLSERGSTVSKAPIAKLCLIVRLAPDYRNERSEVVANLVFELPADMHDEIMSKVILEVMPEAEQEADNTQGDDHPLSSGTCELA